MGAFVVALIAAEGLLSTMLQHVSFEGTSLCAGELTLHASERLLSMCFLRLLFVVHCAGIFKLSADERLLSSVTEHMSFHM